MSQGWMQPPGLLRAGDHYASTHHNPRNLQDFQLQSALGERSNVEHEGLWSRWVQGAGLLCSGHNNADTNHLCFFPLRPDSWVGGRSVEDKETMSECRGNKHNIPGEQSIRMRPKLVLHGSDNYSNSHNYPSNLCELQVRGRLEPPLKRFSEATRCDRPVPDWRLLSNIVLRLANNYSRNDDNSPSDLCVATL